MSAADIRHPGNFLVWIYLVVLAVASLICSSVFPETAGIVAIFVLATAKAALVVVYFMHLRAERIVIHAIAGAPLIFVIILFLGLIPDIVYGR
jgi:caa(3)-type oxidase subunit IV